MLKLKKIAVTGGLASGKTTVCNLFRGMGAEVVSADAIVHHLLSSDTKLIQAITELIGPSVLIDNQLDRKKIAQAVFGKPDLLKSLEKLLHPAVGQAIEEHYKRTSLSGHVSLFVAEIPLLFESGLHHHFDATICVVADENIRKDRYKERVMDASNDFNARQLNQWPQEKKADLAHIIITNNGSLEQLHNEVSDVFKLLTNT